MAIPAKLRPAVGGKREIKHALGPPAGEAKLLIPDYTKAAQAALRAAGSAFACQPR
jgi:hypothetical protein